MRRQDWQLWNARLPILFLHRLRLHLRLRRPAAAAAAAAAAASRSSSRQPEAVSDLQEQLEGLERKLGASEKRRQALEEVVLAEKTASSSLEECLRLVTADRDKLKEKESISSSKSESLYKRLCEAESARDALGAHLGSCGTQAKLDVDSPLSDHHQRASPVIRRRAQRVLL